MPKDQYIQTVHNVEQRSLDDTLISAKQTLNEDYKKESFDQKRLTLQEIIDLIPDKKFITATELMKQAQEAFEKNIFESDDEDIQDKKREENTIAETSKEKNKNIYNLDIKEIEKYLPKTKITNSLDNDIEQQNKNFIEELKIFELNKKTHVLTKEQTEILEVLGEELFPKTFALEICKFIDLQMNIFANEIMNNQSIFSTHIPIFVPDCLRIISSDDIFTKIKKLKIFRNIPVHYIIARRAFIQNNNYRYALDKSEKNYLFACPHKIKNTDKLGIFVFLPDNIFDENMQINTKLYNLPLRLIFFKDFYKYDKFMFGCYEFNLNLMTNLKELSDKDNVTPILNYLFKNNQESTIKSFNELQELVNKKILQIQYSQVKDQNIYETLKALENGKRCLEDIISEENEQKAKKQKVSLQDGKNIYSFNTRHYTLKRNPNGLSHLDFCKKIDYVHRRINEKYIIEVINGSYSLIDLYLNGNFNTSIFSSNKEINTVNQISKNFTRHCNELGLNNNNNLVRSKENAIVLIPERYHINHHTDSKDVQEQKKLDLSNAIISRYHTIVSRRTNKNQRNLQPEDNKVVVALTTEIDNINDDKQNQIFVFLPEGFSYSGKPLLDPNSLSIHICFYKDFKEHIQQTDYPLYSFYILNHINNKRDIDNSRYFYFINAPNIDTMSLLEYMQETYSIFDQRVILRIKGVHYYNIW